MYPHIFLFPGRSERDRHHLDLLVRNARIWSIVLEGSLEMHCLLAPQDHPHSSLGWQKLTWPWSFGFSWQTSWQAGGMMSLLLPLVQGGVGHLLWSCCWGLEGESATPHCSWFLESLLVRLFLLSSSVICVPLSFLSQVSRGSSESSLLKKKKEGGKVLI